MDDWFPRCNTGYSYGFCDTDGFFAHRIISLICGILVVIFTSIATIHTLTYRRDLNDSFILRSFVLLYGITKIIGYGAGIGGIRSFLFLGFFFGFSNSCILCAYIYLCITWAEAYFNVTKNKRSKGQVEKLRPFFLTLAFVVIAVIVLLETVHKCQCVDGWENFGTVVDVIQGLIVIGCGISMAVFIHLMLSLVSGSRQSERMNFLKHVVILSLINVVLIVILIIVPLGAGKHVGFLIPQTILITWAAFILALAGSPQRTRKRILFFLTLGLSTSHSMSETSNIASTTNESGVITDQ